MSSTFMPQAPPAPTPPALLVPVAYATGGGVPVVAAGRGSSSYGPVIAMLAFVAVLAAAAVAVGRLCFGRRAQGHAAGGGHDLEAWVERTCGPCVGATALTAQESWEEGGGSAAAAAGGAGPAAATEPPALAQEGTEQGESSGSA